MKILRTILLTLFIAGMFAACGGGNGPNPSPTNYGGAAVAIG
ncbi:MAG TPA: hypothetical protein VNE19_04525 [Methylomirabilota bacterium]|nr:hypothetical protein [Methylomirabilota bacterium]